MSKSLLVEIGCEELPPKALETLSLAFVESINQSLIRANLHFDTVNPFATPRRLALVVEGLSEQQPDQQIEKLGPAVAAAFDKDGNPSKAALGFARSNGVDFSELQRKQTSKGERLAFCATQKGILTIDLLNDFINDAIKALPVPKRMKWGASKIEFSRPVHWLTCIFGTEVVPVSVLGLKANNLSYGHRFHHPEAFEVNVDKYEEQLKSRKVIANFQQRQALIKQQLLAESTQLSAHLVIDTELLNEVSALVEWPVALVGSFDDVFLQVPKEALISSMKSHQKYFHLLDAKSNLLPNFITVANIKSSAPEIVINGNERVIRPRLSDAAFFYQTDKKKSLFERLDILKSVTFQDKLGSLYNKSQRIAEVSQYIAKVIHADSEKAKRVGLLSKTDLVTEMVGEFPDLQGIMASYYAEHDGEEADVALALSEQYLPKSAEDSLPKTPLGQIIAIADRVDTLVGIFAIGLQPTGNKDPFALRRASLGLIKIIISQNLDIDLQELFQKSAETYTSILPGIDCSPAVEYTLERLKNYYATQDMRTEIFLAINDLGITHLVDFNNRMQALHEFDSTEASSSLSAANKRVNNLLSKSAESVDKCVTINPDLFIEDAEQKLFSSIQSIDADYISAVSHKNYKQGLLLLSQLKIPVDNFFNDVMVLVDNEHIKHNRIALLLRMSQLFSSIANIALLTKP